MVRDKIDFKMILVLKCSKIARPLPHLCDSNQVYKHMMGLN